MKKLHLSKLLAVVAAVPVVSFAGLIGVSYDAGTLYNTTDLTGYQTDGDNMDGMLVTATFADGTAETLAWADISSNSGGVSGDGWSLMEAGDTYGGTWTFTSTSASISNLLIQAGPGNTIFDVKNDAYYTPNSALGWAFSQTSLTNDVDYSATYSDLVGVGGVAPLGDLYLNLELDFVEAFAAGNQLRFIADTDNALYVGDITPSVPEPGSLSLLSIGLLSMLGLVRRKKNS